MTVAKMAPRARRSSRTMDKALPRMSCGAENVDAIAALINQAFLDLPGLGAWRERRRFLGREDQLAAFGSVEQDRVTGAEAAFEQGLREAVLHLVLDHPAQRPGAEHRVVALLAQPVSGGVRSFQAYALQHQVLAHFGQLQVDDGADVLPRQSVEDHLAVDPVHELGPEDALELFHDLVLHPAVLLLLRLRLLGVDREADGALAPDQVGADVGG